MGFVYLIMYLLISVFLNFCHIFLNTFKCIKNIIHFKIPMEIIMFVSLELFLWWIILIDFLILSWTLLSNWTKLNIETTLQSFNKSHLAMLYHFLMWYWVCWLISYLEFCHWYVMLVCNFFCTVFNRFEAKLYLLHIKNFDIVLQYSGTIYIALGLCGHPFINHLDVVLF